MEKKKKDSRARGDCPSCGPARWANVLGEKNISWSDDEHPLWGSDCYRLLECAGCETVYYQHISLFSEDVDYKGPDGEPVPAPKEIYFPSLSKRDRPNWLGNVSFVDADLFALLDSLYSAIDHDLLILAASGVRTAFDLAVEKLGIDPAITFDEKVSALRAQGRIGDYEQQDIAAMVEAANAAMHRGWKPSHEELDTIMTTLERFVHHSFLLEGKAAKLKARVPPKQRRRS